MAQPSANTFDTYDAVGNREHLSNMIYNVSPTETPFFSAISRVSTDSTKHEWQTDALAAAATNYVIEGDDSTLDAVVATARRYNYTQILDKTAMVTGTQEKVSKAGRASEMSYQLAKKSKELMRDLDLALLDNNASVAGNASTAREMAGVSAWITTNYDKNGATNPTGDGTDAWSGGTAIALTEARMKSVFQQTWNSGGNPDMILADGVNKQVISGFSGNGTRMIMANDGKLNAAIDVYVSDFGDVKIVPSRYHESGHILVLDTSLWKFAELRAPHTKELASDGDYTKMLIQVEGTLEACNEKGNGIIVNCTVS